MSKIVLNNITSGYASTAALNAAFDAIEVALENTLSRDGTGPNSMNANLDMNGYAVLNQRATSGNENFVWLGSWATGTSYQANNLVYATEGTNIGNGLICVEAHTAGSTLDGDYAKWEVYVLKGAGVSGGIVGPVSSTIGYIPQWNDVGGTELKAGVPIGSSGGVQAYSANLATLSAYTVGTTTGTVPLWESLLLNGSLSKAATYEVAATDRGKLIDATTGTWSLTIAAGVLSAGLAFAVRNSGTGVITIDPNAAELIDGASTIALAAGESCLVVANAGATEWKTVGRTVSLPEATASVDGYMTSTYAAKLDGIAAGANVGVSADVGVGAVGMFSELTRKSAGANLSPGSTETGAKLVWPTDDTTAVTGTWRLISGGVIAFTGGKGTFQRIA